MEHSFTPVAYAWPTSKISIGTQIPEKTPPDVLNLHSTIPTGTVGSLNFDPANPAFSTGRLHGSEVPSPKTYAWPPSQNTHNRISVGTQTSNQSITSALPAQKSTSSNPLPKTYNWPTSSSPLPKTYNWPLPKNSVWTQTVERVSKETQTSNINDIAGFAPTITITSSDALAPNTYGWPIANSVSDRQSKATQTSETVSTGTQTSDYETTTTFSDHPFVTPTTVGNSSLNLYSTDFPSGTSMYLNDASSVTYCPPTLISVGTQTSDNDTMVVSSLPLITTTLVDSLSNSNSSIFASSTLMSHGNVADFETYSHPSDRISVGTQTSDSEEVLSSPNILGAAHLNPDSLVFASGSLSPSGNVSNSDNYCWPASRISVGTQTSDFDTTAVSSLPGAVSFRTSDPVSNSDFANAASHVRSYSGGFSVSETSARPLSEHLTETYKNTSSSLHLMTSTDPSINDTPGLTSTSKISPSKSPLEKSNTRRENTGAIPRSSTQLIRQPVEPPFDFNSTVVTSSTRSSSSINLPCPKIYAWPF